MDINKKQIEFIYKQSIRKGEIGDVDEDALAALALLSFAISELNFLLRQYLFIRHEFNGPKEMDQINLFQHNTLLRIFSAKIFEATEFVLLKGKYNRSKSQELRDLLKRYQKSFRWLERHPGYKLVKILRDEATNHYTLKAARANLRVLPNDADFSLYHHVMQGNSYYPIGETVMHYGRVMRYSDEGSQLGQMTNSSEFDAWMHWNLAALRWLRRVHEHIAGRLLVSGMPHKHAEKIMLWLPESGAAEPENRLTPFFVRKSNDPKNLT